MKKNFTLEDNLGDNIIAPCDIIARYEELKDELDSLESAVEEAQTELDTFIKNNSETDDDYDEELEEYMDAVEEAKSSLCSFNTVEGEELKILEGVIEDGESSHNWRYEILIRDDYFTDYTEDLINDCFEMPKEINSGNWPYRHMTIDYEAAAEEMKQDYLNIKIGDETYWIRA